MRSENNSCTEPLYFYEIKFLREYYNKYYTQTYVLDKTLHPL